MSIFIKYKGIEVIYEPHFKEYYIVNEKFEAEDISGLRTIEEVKKYIDNLKKNDRSRRSKRKDKRS
jgi:hypothetical protein